MHAVHGISTLGSTFAEGRNARLRTCDRIGTQGCENSSVQVFVGLAYCHSFGHAPKLRCRAAGRRPTLRLAREKSNAPALLYVL
eukprot:4271216-Pleurochrysis_carterae.AAC.3